MADPTETDRRWRLLRDVLVFQLKLGVDALRDLLLSPLSLLAAVLDLVRGADRDRLYFHELLALGRRSEGWIDLFGAGRGEDEPHDEARLDRVVGRVEKLVVEQYERGGITAQAKDAIDRSLDRLSGRRPPNDPA
jgi:hypothetical protein